MFHLQSMVRLGSATLRWLRTPRARPARVRPSLEFLSDRILPSIGLSGLANPDLSPVKTDPALAEVRIIEIPGAAALPPYHDSGALSISSQQLLDVIQAASPAAGLGRPVATADTLEIDGQTVQVLNLSYGSSVTFRLAFGDGDAAAPGEPDSAATSSSNLLGGLVDVYSQGGESRFLLDFGGSGRVPAGRGAAVVAAQLRLRRRVPRRRPISRPRPAGRSSFDNHGPTETQPAAASEGTSPSLAAFLTDRPSGEQIAGGLAAQTADGAGGDVTGEVAVNAPTTRRTC